MAGVGEWMERFRGLSAEGLVGLRPPYPPVALSLDPEGAVLVRVRRRRRGKAVLEGFARRRIESTAIPGSIFEAAGRADHDLGARLRELFALSGTRPGRVSLVLPDNLAKISLLWLPERPASPRQLEELVRSRMRRAVPFRLEDARISHQLLPGAGREVGVLVVLVRRAVVEGLEQALGTIGVRVGLVDLCTPNLVNLYRRRIDEASVDGADVALFNATRSYSSLVILRAGRPIFFRCKTLAAEAAPAARPNGELLRELAGSLSYYREKLAGQGIGTLFVRSVGTPLEALAEPLGTLEMRRILPLDPLAEVDCANRESAAELAPHLAPALGAALGRGR